MFVASGKSDIISLGRMNKLQMLDYLAKEGIMPSYVSVNLLKRHVSKIKNEKLAALKTLVTSHMKLKALGEAGNNNVACTTGDEIAAQVLKRLEKEKHDARVELRVKAQAFKLIGGNDKTRHFKDLEVLCGQVVNMDVARENYQKERDKFINISQHVINVTKSRARVRKPSKSTTSKAQRQEILRNRKIEAESILNSLVQSLASSRRQADMAKYFCQLARKGINLLVPGQVYSSPSGLVESVELRKYFNSVLAVQCTGSSDPKSTIRSGEVIDAIAELMRYDVDVLVRPKGKTSLRPSRIDRIAREGLSKIIPNRFYEGNFGVQSSSNLEKFFRRIIS